jgi:RNA polymerase sigma-70 factor (ECF subfamily)
VRNSWVSLFSGMAPAGDEHEDFDILESYAGEDGGGESSADQVERQQTLAIIDAEVQNCRHVNAKPS